MIQTCLRSKHYQLAQGSCPKAEINVIQPYSKAFIQAIKCLKHTSFHHQAGTCHGTLVLGCYQSPKITCGISVITGKNMSCKTGNSHNYTCMLNCIIRIEKLGSYNSHIFSLTIAHHVLQPIRSNYLCGIIQ